MSSPKVRPISRTTGTIAAASTAILNFGAFSDESFMLGMSLYWVPGGALVNADTITFQYGWFSRPPTTAAEFNNSGQLLTQGFVHISGSALAALLPIGSSPGPRQPYFVVLFTNNTLQNEDVTGLVWVESTSDNRRGTPRIDPAR